MVRLVRRALASFWLPTVLEAVARLGPPRFVRLDGDGEEALLERWTAHADGGVLNLSSSEREQWLEAFELADGSAGSGDESSPRAPLVLVATPAARPALVELVSGVTPHIYVISTAEMAASRQDWRARWVAPP